MSEAKIDVYKISATRLPLFPLAQQPPGQEKCVWAQAQDGKGPVKDPLQERSPQIRPCTVAQTYNPNTVGGHIGYLKPRSPNTILEAT